MDRSITSLAGIMAGILATAALAGTAVAQQAPVMAATPPAFAGQTAAPPPETPSSYRVETLVTGLASPYGFALLPDGNFLVAERPGMMRIARPDGVVFMPLSGLPEIKGVQAGGLHDVTLHPEFAANRLVYFTYTAPPDGEPGARWPASIIQQWNARPLEEQIAEPFVHERLARARLSDDGRALENVEVLLDGLDRRAVFAPDGTLYVLGAERYRYTESDVDGIDRPLPRDVRIAYSGRVARIHDDGSIPAGNPFADGEDGAAPETFSFGHRDPQGAAFHPETGELWTAEHGPMGGDEINIVRPGRDYGWPNITYGLQYSGEPVGTGEAAGEGYEQPVYFWRPSIGPSGIMFYQGDLFPDWRGNLFVAALPGRHLARLVLDGERVVAEEQLLTDLEQRIRALETGPDGAVYVLTDGGMILRLTPGE